MSYSVSISDWAWQPPTMREIKRRLQRNRHYRNSSMTTKLGWQQRMLESELRYERVRGAAREELANWMAAYCDTRMFEIMTEGLSP